MIEKKKTSSRIAYNVDGQIYFTTDFNSLEEIEWFDNILASAKSVEVALAKDILAEKLRRESVKEKEYYVI